MKYRLIVASIISLATAVIPAIIIMISWRLMNPHRNTPVYCTFTLCLRQSGVQTSGSGLPTRNSGHAPLPGLATPACTGAGALPSACPSAATLRAAPTGPRISAAATGAGGWRLTSRRWGTPFALSLRLVRQGCDHPDSARFIHAVAAPQPSGTPPPPTTWPYCRIPQRTRESVRRRSRARTAVCQPPGRARAGGAAAAAAEAAEAATILPPATPRVGAVAEVAAVARAGATLGTLRSRSPLIALSASHAQNSGSSLGFSLNVGVVAPCMVQTRTERVCDTRG